MYTVSCYVELHGYGIGNGPQEPDWYKAVALNGDVYYNLTHGGITFAPGIYTSRVDPNSCSASDDQYFNTNDVSGNGSPNLISYLQSLANGKCALIFSLFCIVLQFATIGKREQWSSCEYRVLNALEHDGNVIPNTHRRRRCDSTVELRRVGVVNMNSQLAHDDCRRIRSTI